MMRRLLLALTKALAFLFLLTFCCAGTALLTVKGPTEGGIRLIQAQLAASPGLPIRLEAYSRGGQSLASLLSIADVAVPVVVAIDFVKNDLQAWDSLLNKLDEWKPGAKRFAQMIDTLTSTLVRIRNELADLGQLSATVTSLRTFALQSSESNMRALGERANSGASALEAIDQELQTIQPHLVDIDRALQDVIVPGLRFVRDNIIVFSEAANRLLPSVSEFSAQLHTTSDTLQGIEEQISADAAALRSIATTVNNVTSANRFLRQLPIYGVSVLISDNIETVEYVLGGLFATMLILLLIEAFVPQKRRQHDQKHAKLTPISQPLAASPQQISTPPVSQSLASDSAFVQVRQPARLHGTLTLQRSGNQSDVFPLPPSGQFVIGSGELVDLRLTDPLVCERHVVIRPARTAYFVETTADSVTVFVNGQAIEKSRKLDDGDIIRVGSTMLVISLQSAHS